MIAATNISQSRAALFTSSFRLRPSSFSSGPLPLCAPAVPSTFCVPPRPVPHLATARFAPRETSFMKITIPHFLTLAAVIAVAGCANSNTNTPPTAHTHNDGSQKVHSGPYISMGSADPQGPREPR